MHTTSCKLIFCLFGLTIQYCFASDCNGVDPVDDPKNIERPCPYFNTDCIRNYLWDNSQCEITFGPVPDPLYLDHYRLEIANSNLTADMNQVYIKGLNGDIIEFYINHETQKCILAMRTKSLKLYALNLTVSYNRKAKEPIVRSDSTRYNYGAVTFTAVFPSICNLDLNDVYVFSYIENSNPEFEIGPRIADTSDCESQKEIDKFYSSGVDNLLEGFVTQGRIFMINFIQYNICNFGSRGKECYS